MFDLEIIDSSINGRFYEDQDGNIYPSVTTKTDKVVPKGKRFFNWALNQRSKKEADEYKDKRAQQGSNVHEACEELASGSEVDLTNFANRSKKMIQGYQNFWDKKNPTIIDLEFSLKSDKYIYAGTADLLAKIPSEDAEYQLIDLKTSSSIYLNHKVQLMMYMQALDEHDIVSLDQASIHILHLKERTNKGYHLKEIEYVPEMVEIFNRLYNHDYFDRADMEPKFPKSYPDSVKLDEDKGKFAGEEELPF